MIGFTLAVAAGLLSSVSEVRAFDCNVTRFDEVSTRVVIYGAGVKESETVPALKTRCETFDKDIAYLQEYVNKCVSGLANGLVKLVLEGATNDMALRCPESAMRDKFLKLVPCLNRHGTVFHECNRNFAAVLESAESKPKKSRVPLSCCYMGVFVDCVTKTARKCGAEHEKLAAEIITNYADDLLSTVCVKWKYGSKACKELPRLSPAPSPKFKSIVAPLAQVLLSLNN